MKLVIAGTRSFADRFSMFVDSGAEVVERALERDDLPLPEDVDVVLSGEASGPDQWGEAFASSRDITVDRYPPEWDKYEDTNRLAPYVRNREMAKEGDVLVAFWDGKSGGTEHMIDKAMEQGMTKHVVRMDKKQTRLAMLKGTDDYPIINTYTPETPSQNLAKVAKTIEE